MPSQILDLRFVEVSNWEEVNASITILREVSDQILTSVSSSRDEQVFRVGDEVKSCHPTSSLEVSDRHSIPRLDREISQKRIEDFVYRKFQRFNLEFSRQFFGVPRISTLHSLLLEKKKSSHFFWPDCL